MSKPSRIPYMASDIVVGLVIIGLGVYDGCVMLELGGLGLLFIANGLLERRFRVVD